MINNGHDDDEFYVILPSNASPKRHPSNNASDYVVTWENAINLDPNAKWKVAMTEMNYIYSTTTLDSSYQIRYKKLENYKEQVAVEISYNKETKQLIAISPNQELQAIHEFQAEITKDGRIQLATKTPFRWIPIKDNVLELSAVDLSGKSVWNNKKQRWELTFEKPLLHKMNVDEADDDDDDAEAKKEMYFGYQTLRYKNYYPREYVYTFGSNVTFSKVSELIAYIAKSCKDIFFKFESTAKKGAGKVRFQTNWDIYEIEFLNGLHFVLGFEVEKFSNDTKEVITQRKIMDETAKYIAQLKRGNTNMYIYASICQPIRIGHSMAPILKNVHVDMSNDFEVGHSRHYIVYNPMYLDVATTSFNSIEINIRNDAGQVIVFPRGAVTCITLHFKRSSINKGCKKAKLQ